MVLQKLMKILKHCWCYILLVLVSDVIFGDTDNIIDLCLDSLMEGNSNVPFCRNKNFNITFSDPKNCSNFFYCRGASLYPAQCPAGLLYNYKFEKCTLDEISCKFPCDDESYLQYIVMPSSNVMTSFTTLTSQKIKATSSTIYASLNLTTPLKLNSTVLTIYTTTNKYIIFTTSITTSSIYTEYKTHSKKINTELTITYTTPTESTASSITYTTLTRITVPTSMDILTYMTPNKDTSSSVNTVLLPSSTNYSNAILSSVTIEGDINETLTSIALTTLFTKISTIFSKPLSLTTSYPNSGNLTESLSSEHQIFNATSMSTTISKSSLNSNFTNTVYLSTEKVHTDKSVTNDLSSSTIAKSIDDIITEYSKNTTASLNFYTSQEVNNTSAHTQESFSSETIQHSAASNSTVATVDTSPEFISATMRSMNVSTVLTNWTDTTSCYLGKNCNVSDVVGDPDNCSRYYICLAQLDKNRWMRKDCLPDNKYFDAVNLRCISHKLNATCTVKCYDELEHTISMEPDIPKAGSLLIFKAKSRIKISYNYIWIEDFVWRLNGQKISPIINAITIVNRGPDSDGYQYSTLIFRHPIQEYSGEIECTILYGASYMKNTTMRFHVIADPIINIEPKYAGSKMNDSLTISCKLEVSNQNKIAIDTKFHWFVDGILITERDQEFFIHSPQSSPQIISTMVFKVKQDHSISCIATNEFGESQPAFSSVYLLNSNSTLVCIEENSKWPPANIGQVVSIPCSSKFPDYNGLLFRTCFLVNGLAKWSKINSEDCYLVKFLEYEQRINNLLNGIGENAIKDIRMIVNDMFDIIKIDNLNAKELSMIFNDTFKLLNIVNYLELTDEELIMSIFSLVDEIFSMDFSTAFGNDTKMATDMIFFIENITMNYAKTIKPGDSKDFNTFKNMVIEVSCQNTSKDVKPISFPISNNDNVNNHIFVPSATLKNGTINDIIFVSSIFFNNLQDFFPKNKTSFINSPVISLSIDGLTSKKLNPNIFFNLEKINKTLAGYFPFCSYWNIAKESWERDGCKQTHSNFSLVHCECDHLTNFAILMSLSPATESDAYILSIVSTIGCAISIAALFFTIVIYIYRWKKVRSHHAVVILNLCIALIIAYSIFLAGADKTDYPNVCMAVAILLHYFFLVVFCLMLIGAIDLFISVMYVFHVRRKRETVVLLLTAWVIPMVIVSLTLAATQLQGYGGAKSCWLQLVNGVIWAFVGPALFIIAVNITISVIIMVRICGLKRPAEKDNLSFKIKATLWNILVIMPVVGLAWVFGVLSVNQNLIAFQYIFTIFNSLQGLLIFLFYGLCNKPVSNKNKPSYHHSPYTGNHSNHRRSLDDVTYMISSSSDNSYHLTGGRINPCYNESTSGYSHSTGTTILHNIEEEGDVIIHEENRPKAEHTLSTSTISSGGSGLHGYYQFNSADNSF